MTNVRGQFNDFNRTINLDPANLEKSSVEFRVKAASALTKDLKDLKDQKDRNPPGSPVL